MRILRHIRSLHKADYHHIPGAVVALGNFDGVHLGHAQVIAEAKALARASHAPLAVLTFEPHPRKYFQPKSPPLRIMSVTEKLCALKRENVDIVYIAPFTAAFARVTAEQFIREWLVEAMQVRHVVTGHNFVFGHQRRGNAEMLMKASAVHGFGYTAVEGVRDTDGKWCSSSRIRNYLREGNLSEANRLLGHAYSITGRIQHGDKRGRTLNAPTANIVMKERFLPKYGVYAVNVQLPGEDVWVPAVANLGVRPTFGGDRVQLEVYVIDRNIDLYAEKITVEFQGFIREERKFESLEALKSQIARDVHLAKTQLQPG